MKSGVPCVWYLRHSQLENGLWHAAAYENDENRDGQVVDLESAGQLPQGWLWRTDECDEGLLHVDYANIGASPPALWFVNVDEPRAHPVATNLVGFATDHRKAGTIVSRYSFATMGVNNDEQVCAVRWYRNGIVHQIFVAPTWRKQSVATALLVVADAFHQANGWRGYLRSDGRRTDLGQRLAAAIKYPRRVAPLEQTMPSMDLPE